MCQAGFLFKSPSTTGCKFLEDLPKKTMQWETIRDDNLNYRYSAPRDGMHVVSDFSHLESKSATHKNKMKGLVLQKA